MCSFCSPMLLGHLKYVRVPVLILTGQGFEYGYMSENACQSDMQTIGVSNKEEE